MYIYAYVCVCVCVCVYKYTHVYIQVLTNEAGKRGQMSVAKARTVLKLMQEAGLKADLRVYRGMIGVFVEAVGAKGGEGMMVETFRLLDRMRAAGVLLDPCAHYLQKCCFIFFLLSFYFLFHYQVCSLTAAPIT